MRIWLDDVRPMPPGFDAHALTAADAIRWLTTGSVKFISLDHDLGSEDDQETGYFVASWIEVAAHNGWIPALEWAIHSANPVGRKNMEMALQKAKHYWNSGR